MLISGLWRQVAELLLGLPVPVVYFEQGHEWLFGDPIRFQVGHRAQAAAHAWHNRDALDVADQRLGPVPSLDAL